MATQTQALTAQGASAVFSLKPGQSITYSSTGTFTGFEVFQRSRNGGASWETLQAPAVDTNVTTKTIKNESPSEQRFRFSLFDTDAVTPVTGTATTVIADVDDVVIELRDNTGRVYQIVRDSGVEFPGTTVLENVTLSGTLGVVGNVTLTGDLAVNGGDLTTSATTFNLVDATATTVNLARAATTLVIGATTGTATLRNATVAVTNALTVGTTLGLTGALTYGGVALSAAVTGTGAMVLATSPTIVTPVINSAASVGGTWSAAATWTLPALTLGGTVSGGGNQLNNVIIGTSTPLAGSFTTLNASGLFTGSSALISRGDVVGRAFSVEYNSSNTPLSMVTTNSSGDTYLAWNAASKVGSDTATFVITGGGAGKITCNNTSNTIVTSVASAGGTAGADITWVPVTSLTAAGFAVTGAVSSSTTMKAGGYTVGTLPSNAVGTFAYVTDQLTAVAAKGVAPTGGGAVFCYVANTGAGWVGI